ncbi:MAG TPA: COX15/CtaA family protein [Gemmatimonadales bacterium]|nr:COX15/CtaA family protein [Gemmatimonadales bacterium]
MTRRFEQVAWAAATATYLLIVLGAIVRITGSGLGCGEHWPLCNGRWVPPPDLPTMIEFGHRLVAALVSVLVATVAGMAWWLARGRSADAETGTQVPTWAATAALALLVIQVALGAITVKLDLPPWTVILHLGTAMLILASLLVVARGGVGRPSTAAIGAAALGFVTVLLGALTANMGAARACLGFPLCSGHVVPSTPLQDIQWIHRLLAYTLAGYTLVWAFKSGSWGARYAFALVLLQGGGAAAMVLLNLPQALQAAHVAVGTGVWAELVLAAL